MRKPLIVSCNPRICSARSDGSAPLTAGGLARIKWTRQTYPMSKIVTLSKVRKAKSRAEKRAQADANSVRFGRTKSQRKLESSLAEKAERALDRHERE